nr:MAG TPA: RNA dependent RNA polymerase [Caudoviricetes sp.]
MGKAKQFIMRAFTKVKVTPEKIEIECTDLKASEVRLGYNFLCDTFTKHYNIEENLIEDIFKLTLPSDEENAIRFCEEGVLLNNERYYGWFSSTSMMKDEDFEEDTKCEMLFIKKDKADFRQYFERLITLKKIDDLYGTNVKMCKDYLSRLSLTTSTSTKITYQPSVVILPELSYKHTANYKIPKLTDAGIVLEDRPDFKVDHVFCDGGGIMSPRLADEIQRQMGLDYEVGYCIFRHYPMAMKGGLIRVDFEKFIDEFYTHNTDTFEKMQDGTYRVKDIFNKWRNINDVDIIVNESSAKWYKHWKGQSQKAVYEAINKLDEVERDLMSSIYVTKVNKKECKKMSLANYQLLGNLSLTVEEMQELSLYTEAIYKRILEDDIDTLKLFLNDIVKQDIEDTEPEEVVPSTKMKALLNIDESLIHLGYVQKSKARLINKKVRQLCGGKFYINADWKYMIADPITFLYTMMRGNNSNVVYHDSSLKEGEFYIYNNANKEVALERCPLNCYNEVRKVTTVTNNVYERYMPKCEEVIIFNQRDNLHLDGDFDGDQCLVVKDKLIIDNVVECIEDGKKWWFYNPDDDKASAISMEFNDHNKIVATIKASGNDICRLANWGMILSNQATSIYKYKSIKTDKEYAYEQLKDKAKQQLIKDGHKNDKDLGLKAYELINNAIKKGKFELSNHKNEDLAKSLIETTKTGFYLLRLQQLGIDKSKTLKSIPDHEFDYAKSLFKGKKKPRFLKYIKEVSSFETEHTLNPLNINALRIASELYREDVESMEAKDNAWMLYPYLHTQLEEDEVEIFNELKEMLQDVYDEHNKEYAKIRMARITSDEKKPKYRQLDADTTLLCKEIEDKYGYRLVAYACERLELSGRFIITYLWNTLESCLHVDKCRQFLEAENGEYEYVGKRYNAVWVPMKLSENLQAEAIQRANKTMGIVSGDIRVRLIDTVYDGDILLVSKTDKEPQLTRESTSEVVGSIFVDYIQMTDTVNLNDVKKIKIESVKKVAKTGKSADVIITTM